MIPSPSNEPVEPRWAKVLVGFTAVLSFLGLSWYLYQNAIFLRSTDVKEVSQENEVMLQNEDTLEYRDFRIVRRERSTPRGGTHSYGVDIFKNGKLTYRHPKTVEQKEFCEMGLASLLGDHTQQLILQQFTGGSDCCWNSWVLELGDSLRTLYRSEDFPEIGHEIDFADFDGDGQLEIAQPIVLFNSFDRIDYSQSPFPPAYFQYSAPTRRFIPANKAYSALFLKRAEELAIQVMEFAESGKWRSDGDANGQYLALVLAGTLEYVFAGHEDQGWAFFERWYILPDRDTLRGKIQTVLESSKLYRSLNDAG